MMLCRRGNVLHAFSSSDGSHFTELTNATTGITWSGMSASLKIGIFSSSASTANARAVIANFSIAGPSALSDADIGFPGQAGSASVVGGVLTVKGGGSDIWNTSDQFNFCSEAMTGVQTLVVHVQSVSNADIWSKAGLMFRNSINANSAFIALETNPTYGVSLQWRDTDGGACGSLPLVGDATHQKWIMLIKNGATFTASYAITTAMPGASDWIAIGTHTTTVFTNTTYLGGLEVCAHNNSLLCTAVFDTLTISGVPAIPVASSYTDLDIGSPPVAGSAAVSGNTVTMVGSGSDIWNSSDQFNYYFQPNSKDVTLIVHVDSVAFTDYWARGGAMFRGDATAGGAYVMLAMEPNQVVSLQWRDVANTAASGLASQVGTGGTAKWLKLIKSGNTFAAYYASTATPVATDWILVGTHSTTFTGATYLGGLAVTSHSAVSSQAVFDSFSQQ